MKFGPKMETCNFECTNNLGKCVYLCIDATGVISTHSKYVITSTILLITQIS